jgi:L-serine deaminase
VKKGVVRIEREAKDCRRKLQKREAPAIADIRQVVGQLGAQLRAVFEENGPRALASAEICERRSS